VLQDRSWPPPQGPPGAKQLTRTPDHAQQPPPEPAARERIRARLLRARSARTRPGLDDKRLTAWNALMISALAETGAHLDERRPAGVEPDMGAALLDAARECAEFVLRDLRDERGRLLRTYSQGRGKIDAYLEDHAFLLEALLALFEATCEERWFEQATALADEIIARFADPERGGFFSTAGEQEPLVARRKELEDTPIPAGGSSAALGLLRLAQLTGEPEYERHAVSALRLLHEIAPRHPTAFGHLLQAIHWHLAPARPIACPIPESGHAGRALP